MEFRVCDPLDVQCTHNRSNGNANVVETDIESRSIYSCANEAQTHRGQAKRENPTTVHVLRSTTIYIEFACVCQFANCRANRQKFLTAKWMRYDGFTWHITSMLSHCKPLLLHYDRCMLRSQLRVREADGCTDTTLMAEKYILFILIRL